MEYFFLILDRVYLVDLFANSLSYFSYFKEDLYHIGSHFVKFRNITRRIYYYLSDDN